MFTVMSNSPAAVSMSSRKQEKMKKTAAQAKKKAPKSTKTRAKAPKKPAKLLGRGEPAPVRVENPRGRAKCVIVCDHASNRVPKALGTMGLKKAELKKHIAWDPGTEDIGYYLSKKMDAALVLANYSRLVVDLNRGEDAPECMRAESDHIRIPANEGLTAAQKKQRIGEIFNPYHKVLGAQLKRHIDKGVAPLLLSLHSFTPEMDGFKRPWHIGVLWNKEEGIAKRLVESLRKNNPDLRIGDNEPYSLKAANVTKNTISTHAEARGLPYVIVEFRQDLVGTKAGARKWAEIFLQSLAPVIADPELYRLKKRRK